MKKAIILLIFSALAFEFFSCATKKVSKEELEKTAQYHFKVGVSYLNSGNMAEAIYNLNQAYTIKPHDPDILNALGIAYTKVGELDKAQEYFLKAIQSNPKKAESYVNLGILLAKKKDYGSAEEYFKKAIKNPNYKNKEKAYYNLALVYLKLGNLEKYEESLKKAIAYNNFFLPAYEELGNYYMQQEEYDKAKTLYEKAISLGLGSPDIYYNLGLIFYKKGNFKLAKYYLKKGLILSQENLNKKIEIQKLLSKIESHKKSPEIKKVAIKEEKKVIIEKESNITEKTKEKEKEKIIIFPGISKNQKEYIPREPIKKEVVSNKKSTKNISKESEIIVKKTKPEKKEKTVIRFYVNLGTFSSKKEALKLRSKLKLYGYTSKIEKINVDGTIFYIVYIGYFDSYLKASRFYKKNLKPIGFKGIIKFKRVKLSETEKG